MGVDHYKALIKEKSIKKDSYVIETSVQAYFSPDNGGTKRQLRGAVIDPDKLESQVGVDSGIWLDDGGISVHRGR